VIRFNLRHHSIFELSPFPGPLNLIYRVSMPENLKYLKLFLQILRFVGPALGFAWSFLGFWVPCAHFPDPQNKGFTVHQKESS